LQCRSSTGENKAMKHFIPNTRRIENLKHQDQAEKFKDVTKPQKLNWELIDNFVVDTVLGLHRTKAMALDENSKAKLNIPKDHNVILPGEERRARMEQVKDFCELVLKTHIPVNGFEVAYLLEMFDTREDTLAHCLPMEIAVFRSLIDEDEAFDISSSSKIALFFLHAWSVKNGSLIQHG
jgi:hypothetical protein